MDSKFESFNQRLTAVAAANSGRPAVSLGGETVYTYGQLIEKARAVAHRLQQSGVGPEDVIGLALPKSPQYVAAMLGIWFAGAAFVPLDPALPADNLEYRCRQAGVKAVLTLGAVQEGETFSGAFGGAQKIVFDSIEPAPADFKIHANTARELAYIIFTSGSTGRPKGVMVEHRGIVNFIDAQIESFALTAESRSLWMLSTNFDASVSDLGTALLAGAHLFIEESCELSPRAGLEEKLAALKISHVDMPPSVLRLMDPAKLPPTLQTIIIGGEACAPDVVRTYAAKLRLINVYGPTESTVCTSLGRCDTVWQRALIGQPLPGVSYHVLDESLAPVAPGETGELYIGGVQLARGYVGREDLTAQRFITCRTNKKLDARLYKTGDLIKLCQDGEYQFVGRSDRQFKLRGMLIEPEEVEARLLQYQGVERAAVLKRAVSASNERVILVAFFSGRARPGELRKYLEGLLPAWMVPQRFENLDEMPLTITGKIDLAALSQKPLAALPTAIEVHRDDGGEADVRAMLKSIWQNILGVEPRDEDDFFVLGGDSFAVVEAVVAAQARGVNISPALFLANPTFGRLVAVLCKENEGKTQADATAAETLRKDIAFDAEQKALIEACRAKPHKIYATTPGNIFITGATGFLGARLLSELLLSTEADIYCLVRGPKKKDTDNEQDKDRIAGLSKIAAALAAQDLSGPDPKRVHPVFGQLDAPDLGLSSSEWKDLSEKIDTIFHSGARVNMLDSYEQLKATNVQGTWEIARLMMNGRAKVLHYASTLSVFVATDKNQGELKETDDLSATSTIYGGYAQSKWAAEVMLRNLEGKAGPIIFHRLGLITGDSQSGRSSSHDFLQLFARGLGQLGCAPRQSVEACPELAVDITPVDYAARAMVKLSLTAMATASSRTYHIAGRGNLTLKRLLACMTASGRPVELVDGERFKERLLASADSLGTSAAACLALCRALGDDQFASFRSMDLFQATDVLFSQLNTEGDLEGSGIVCPEPDDRLVCLYLEHA